MPPGRRTTWITALCLAGAAMIAACLTNPDSKKPPALENNSEPPSANERVVQQRIGGDASKGSAFEGTVEAADGTWFAYGLQNNNPVVIRLGGDGTAQWTRVAGYRARGARAITTPWSPLATVLVTVGGFDSDNNGRLDQGKVSLYRADGTPLSELTLATPGGRIFLNDVAVSATNPDRYDLVVVGGTGPTDLSFMPYVAHVGLRSDGGLERGGERSYPGLGWSSLANVVCEASPSPAAIYANGNVWANDSTIVNAMVLRLSDALDVSWRTDFVSTPGLKSTVSLGGLQWDSGSLVVAGRTEVADTPPRTGGCCWSGGLIESLSSQGQIQWQQTVTLTRYTEYFTACYVVGPHVYAVGGAAIYHHGSTNQVFGYGLVTKLVRATGAVVANLTIGDRSYRSTFLDLTVRADHAYCLGWTHYLHPNGGYQSWYAEVGLAPGPVPPAAAVPGVPAEGDAAPVTGVFQGPTGGDRVD